MIEKKMLKVSEKKHRPICFFQLTVNETVFLSLLANAVNSGYDRGERSLSAVQCSLPC